MAGRLRPDARARPRRSSGSRSKQVVFSLTRPSGPAVLNGPEPHRRRRQRARTRPTTGATDHCWWLDRMVRSDQPLVERMTYIWHDWFANSNEKVDDQQRMLEPERPVPRTRAGELPRPVPGGHDEPGDARLPRRHLQRQVGPERELRPRDDGAVLARRRPRRLHRGRRPRNGPHADRLDAPNGPKAAALQTSTSTPSRHDDGPRPCSARPATGTGRRRRAVRHPPAAPVLLRQPALELLRPGPAAREATLASLQGALRVLGLQHRAGRRGDPPCTPTSSTGPNW